MTLIYVSFFCFSFHIATFHTVVHHKSVLNGNFFGNFAKSKGQQIQIKAVP